MNGDLDLDDKTRGRRAFARARHCELVRGASDAILAHKVGDIA